MISRRGLLVEMWTVVNMPVDLQYLSQSLQSLTLDEDPALENEAIAGLLKTPV